MTYRYDDILGLYQLSTPLTPGKLVKLQPTRPMLIDARASARFDQATAMLGIRANGVCVCVQGQGSAIRRILSRTAGRLVNLRRQIGSGAIK